MKLTLKQKRDFVSQFWSGKSFLSAMIAVKHSRSMDERIRNERIFEQILRDYMNGKFKLKEPK